MHPQLTDERNPSDSRRPSISHRINLLCELLVKASVPVCSTNQCSKLPFHQPPIGPAAVVDASYVPHGMQQL